jgi:plasmid stabilization system protein ParE
VKIRILPSAAQDLDEGFSFYEKQSEGLGQYFDDSLFSDIESLRIHAGIHSKVLNFHRFFSKRFPYAIYYKKDSETVYVYAVLDCRKDPTFHLKRLGNIQQF